MISFDLKCTHDHVFEGWFRSSGDYEDQRGKRQVACPVCGSADVAKAVMAPAVAAKSNRRGSAPAGTVEAPPSVAMASGSPDQAKLEQMLGALAQAQAEMLEKSQWVGDKFAEQARAMYYGEAEQAPIHGTTNAREARAMMEEGVPVAPLIVPVAPPESTH
ncbi:MAG: DUF1178 family protein [Sphingobium sp.]|nr:DUF1178 family protein [Sphingobium sp.]